MANSMSALGASRRAAYTHSVPSFRYTYAPTPVTNVQITDRFERGTTLKKPVGVAVGAVVRDGIRDETYFAYVVTGDEKIVGFEVVNKDGAPALKYSEEIMGREDDPDVLANPTSIVLSTDGAYAFVGLGMKGGRGCGLRCRGGAARGC